MKVWTVSEPGGIDKLIVEDRPQPEPKEDEVLVRVKAFGINRLEIGRRESMEKVDGQYPVMGVEFAGEVVVNHSDRSDLEEGTRVMSIIESGSHAEFVSAPADRLMVIPEHLSFEEAAAIPEVWLTAYQTMYWIADLQPEESILIYAAASGVGSAAVQMARQISNAKILGTSSQASKLEALTELGIDAGINRKEESIFERVQEVTDGRGVDVILDFVGASNWQLNLDNAAVDARWVVIGALGGVEVDSFNLGQILQKRLNIMATLLSPRSSEYKAKLSQEFAKEVLPRFENGDLKPIIDQVFDFEDLPKAHERMENNNNTGKLIVKF